MDFKINSIRPAQVAKYQEVTRKAAVQTASPQASDKVDLSESSRMFKAMLQTIKTSPEVRQEKIDAVKAQIDSGTYEPDSRAIADKMLGYITPAIAKSNF